MAAFINPSTEARLGRIVNYLSRFVTIQYLALLYIDFPRLVATCLAVVWASVWQSTPICQLFSISALGVEMVSGGVSSHFILWLFWRF